MKRKIFTNLFKREIKSRRDLIRQLKDASSNQMIDGDSIAMIEAIFNLTELNARDIMIPRYQIDVIDVNDSISSIVTKITTTGHSRFPVIDGEISKIVGIFHSKDLVAHLINNADFDIRDHLRKVYFVPEIKRLDTLMYEMRINHTHLVVVVDEFTNVVGVVTLEMIIEQIVGEIEDEYDSLDGEGLIVELTPNEYRVKGYCKLSEISKKVGVVIVDEIVETIGGYLIKFLGRLPENGEQIRLESCQIEIISADSRKINLVRINK
jgi:magnesium and cobalt transporter